MSTDIWREGYYLRNGAGSTLRGEFCATLRFLNLSKKYLFQPCKTLWCKTENPGCVSSNIPWADGTPCGGNSWCVKGRCIPKNEMKPTPVNGGWGPWSDFSGCSLPCGGGVQHSKRECNNPTPQNGGKYCTGNRKKYRSCNTNNCGPETIDMRQKQCSEFGRSTGMSSSFSQPIVWVPKYGCELDLQKNFQ